MVVWPGAITFLIALLLILLGYRRYQSCLKPEVFPDSLEFSPKNSAIYLKNGPQRFFYPRYLVFNSRWFLVLQLFEKSQRISGQTLFLCRTNFESADDYASIRRLLIQADPSNAAGNQ